MRKRVATVSAGLALVVALGCGEESTSPPPVNPAGAMPDFSLLDVNPNSSTHNQMVSPRRYLDWVSAYYFGSAT